MRTKTLRNLCATAGSTRAGSISAWPKEEANTDKGMKGEK